MISTTGISYSMGEGTPAFPPVGTGRTWSTENHLYSTPKTLPMKKTFYWIKYVCEQVPLSSNFRASYGNLARKPCVFLPLRHSALFVFLGTVFCPHKLRTVNGQQLQRAFQRGRKTWQRHGRKGQEEIEEETGVSEATPASAESSKDEAVVLSRHTMVSNGRPILAPRI